MRIKMKGLGAGAGEVLEVLTPKQLRKKIESYSTYEIVKLAWENQNYSFQDGLAVIDMVTGELSGYPMSRNSSNQACDDQEIVLCRIDANAEVSPYDFAEGLEFDDNLRQQSHENNWDFFKRRVDNYIETEYNGSIDEFMEPYLEEFELDDYDEEIEYKYEDIVK